jgi:hypothetical protein
MKEYNNLEAYCQNITITGTKSRMERVGTSVARTGVDEYTQSISQKILEKKYTYMNI